MPIPDAPDFQLTVVLNSDPLVTVPGPDSPDWQMTVQLVNSIQSDAPDWQQYIVGPGGVPISPTPPPALPVIVQSATGFGITTNTITVTLASTPTPGNQLIAFYGNIGNNVGTFTPPGAPPAGFSLIGSAYGYNAPFSEDSTALNVLQHVVKSGDGKSWDFLAGSGGPAFLSMVALYEVTPSGQIIVSSLGSPGVGSNPYLISCPTALASSSALGSLGIAGCCYLGNLSGGTPPILISGGTLPTGGWAADLLVYDTGGTLYGDVQTWTAKTTIGASAPCVLEVQYTAVNAENPTAGLVMCVFPPAG